MNSQLGHWVVLFINKLLLVRTEFLQCTWTIKLTFMIIIRDTE